MGKAFEIIATFITIKTEDDLIEFRIKIKLAVDCSTLDCVWIFYSLVFDVILFTRQ